MAAGQVSTYWLIVAVKRHKSQYSWYYETETDAFEHGHVRERAFLSVCARMRVRERGAGGAGRGRRERERDRQTETETQIERGCNSVSVIAKMLVTFSISKLMGTKVFAAPLPPLP